MNTRDDDVICQVRESFSGLRMDMPVEKVFASGRVRRRRQLLGLMAAYTVAAGTAAAVTLAHGGPAPARSGNPPSPIPGSVMLVAFSVTNGPSDSTMLILRKGPQYRMDPSELRQTVQLHHHQ